MELEQVHSLIIEQGFMKNNKTINGFIPHYIKGENTCLFVINAGFWNSKIVTIHHHFVTLPQHEFQVFGVLSENHPPLAAWDWVLGCSMKLIRLNPLEKAEFSSDHQDLIYKPFSFL